MSQLDVIATRGAAVLIRVDRDHGRILDRRHGRLFPPQTLDSALARGQWKAFTGDTAEISQALATATEVTTDAQTPGLLSPAA